MKHGDLALLKEKTIRRGCVFRMTFYPSDGVTPKNPGDTSRDKYFTILGISDNKILVGSFLINTEINQNLYRLISPYQLCLKASDYDFLGGKDRYLDCFQMRKLEYPRVLEEAEYVGELLQIDIEWAEHLANESRLNSDDDLKEFGIFHRT